MDRFRGDVDGEGARMSFMEHLLELRKRLWTSIMTIFVCVAVAMVFYEELFAFMRGPLDRLNATRAAGMPKVNLNSTDPMDTLVMVMWLSIGAGVVLSSPMLLYQLWGFIAPGLREKERRAIKPVLFGGIFFFLLGAGIAYAVLFPVAIRFFFGLNVGLDVTSIPTVEKYCGLLLNMMAISGLICEAPLVVAAFAKLGVVKPEHLTGHWRICVLVAFILGAVFSPGTEVMSMLLFSALLLCLYAVSIFMAYAFYPKDKDKDKDLDKDKDKTATQQ